MAAMDMDGFYHFNFAKAQAYLLTYRSYRPKKRFSQGPTNTRHGTLHYNCSPKLVERGLHFEEARILYMAACVLCDNMPSFHKH